MELNDREIPQQLFAVIKKIFWDVGTPAADQMIYDELKSHAIAALAAPVLPDLSLSPELYKIWEKTIIQQFAQYYRYLNIQSSLPISVPYIILKGTSASKYYPHPEYRALGDIDIITRREDYQAACDMLLANGYREIENVNEEDKDRHREFKYRNIVVEVHQYFASLNDPGQAEYMDNLIVDNINSSHILPELVNGLVLLEHISQHLEHGLGLRQIIDWMMFVNRCLPDEKWAEFQSMAAKTGLEKFAIITTRMCEIYLGLPERKWCAEADEGVCCRLMNYVLECGNFGVKWESESHSVTKIMTYSRTPKSAFKLLQKKGISNWNAAQKHRILRPFAWIYQAGHYICKSISRSDSITKFRSEFEAAKLRNALFDDLGVKQTSKGLIIYKNGKYRKE